MPRTWSRRTLLRRLLLLALAAGPASGCGTILYPERRGQPGGPIDWKVFALDGIFLLLFVIPGVIAFAVDFSTGAIYLPTGCESGVPVSATKVPRGELHPNGIARAVSRLIGRTIHLKEGEYATEELNTVDELPTAFEQVALRERRDPTVLRCQSPE